MLGDCLEAVDRLEEAVAADRDAVGALSDAFMRLPAAFAERMMTLLRDYLRRAEKLGEEPDAALLMPILQKLQAMADHDAKGEEP